jgi:hypothetical protein
MKESELEKLVDNLISKINAIELSKADQIYNEIDAFKKFAHHSDNKFILEDIEKIKGDFRKAISKYDKTYGNLLLVIWF